MSKVDNQPKFNSKIAIAPNPKIKISFFEIRSRNISAPLSKDSKITPILSVGKSIALSSIPASVVLSKLQLPKNRPTQDAAAMLRGCIAEDLVFLPKKVKTMEMPEASKNAINKKRDFCSANADFCCSFCTIPSPPEASMAMTSGIK